MKTRIGTDIVYIPHFTRTAKQGGENFLGKIFFDSELENGISMEHLAGLFAAKEAVIKALSLPAGSWHTIVIRYDKNGKPVFELLSNKTFISSDLSISHDKDYAIAVVLAIF